MGLSATLVKLLKNGAKNGAKNGGKNGAKNGAKNGHLAVRELQGPLLPKVDGYYPKPAKVSQFSKGKASRRKVLDPVQHEANAVKYINTKGSRKTGEVNFIDQDGNTSYMNKAGDNLQYTNLRVKGGNNSKLQGRRANDVEAQTRPDIDESQFYKQASSKKDAHHIAGLDQLGPLFDGLDSSEQSMMIGLLEKNGIFAGNNTFNRADLSSNVHKQLHSWMSENGMLGRKGKDLSKLPFKKRMEALKEVIADVKASERKMFDLRMAEKHGEVWMSHSQFGKSVDRVTRPELAAYE